ncbi:hypothetical protein PROFUN_04958 [Planoprotostelium fungivorum]|uniref:Uncharacterized protein n=1 Tax=Planoprotostelium fungivorum TaxID=1890364 RepID=A0A2P6NSQ3_9EUKA|nr:hypothetical protein PROFUN_04958 [Planoprotostelium fungivorum]
MFDGNRFPAQRRRLRVRYTATDRTTSNVLDRIPGHPSFYGDQLHFRQPNRSNCQADCTYLHPLRGAIPPRANKSKAAADGFDFIDDATPNGGGRRARQREDVRVHLRTSMTSSKEEV